MSLFETLKSFFGSTSHPEGGDLSAVDQVFKYLVGIVRDANQVTSCVEEIRAARFSAGAAREGRLIRAYFKLEKLIVSSTPTLSKYATPTRLRESVRSEADIAALPENLRLIFLPAFEQTFGIYAFGVKSALAYVATYSGERRVTEILGGVFKDLPPDTLDFAAVEKALKVQPKRASLDTLRLLYRECFNEVRKSFGEAKAVDVARSGYEFFKTTYDAAFTAQFLEILPEGVLEVERLAFLSRRELERKIRERTKELDIFNAQLEEKVVERTKELTVANERLRELDKVKTEFISVAAHQLRTPLSAVKWTLSLLIDEHADNLTFQQKGLLMKGYESNERMINLINNMLVVTRIESGKMQYALQQVRVEDLIDIVLLDFVGEVATRHVTLSFRRPEKQLPCIEVDSEKIRAVIQNLIENALCYTREGGVVTISAVREGDTVRVSVEDNGIGIPDRQRLGIFNKFFRADNAAKMKTDGSGLGLFVAKNIIDRHGGTIGFQSKEHVGTTFYFTLPIADRAAGGK